MRKVGGNMRRPALVLIALGLSACYPPQSTTPSDTRQTQTVNVITGGGSPPPSCPGVQNVTATVPSSIHVGVAVGIKVASIAPANGPACDAGSSPAWSVGVPCQVSDTASVATELTASATGTCLISGCLSGICDPHSVTVVP